MMKLSDAIEKGWQYVPKIEDEYQRWDYEEHKITGACAIGAACYAARPGEATTCDIEAYRIFPQLRDLVKVEKEGQTIFEGHLSRFITVLNDNNPVEGYPVLETTPTQAEIVAAVRQLGY
jgi:hypothetical protein